MTSIGDQDLGKSPFVIDDELLDGLGFEETPTLVKRCLITQVYDDISMRVGVRLTESMDADKVDEFGAFAEKDIDKVQALLDQYFSLDDPKNLEVVREEYRKASQDAPGLSLEQFLDDFLPDFGAHVWIEKNCPDYREHIKAVIDEVCDFLAEDPAAALEYYLEDILDILYTASGIYHSLCALLAGNQLEFLSNESGTAIKLWTGTSSFVVLLNIHVDYEKQMIRQSAQLPLDTSDVEKDKIISAINICNSKIINGYMYHHENTGISYVMNYEFTQDQPSIDLLARLLDDFLRSVGVWGAGVFGLVWFNLTSDALDGRLDTRELSDDERDEAKRLVDAICLECVEDEVRHVREGDETLRVYCDIDSRCPIDISVCPHSKTVKMVMRLSEKQNPAASLATRVDCHEMTRNLSIGCFYIDDGDECAYYRDTFWYDSADEGKQFLDWLYDRLDLLSDLPAMDEPL
ncbi:MAG: DUF5663 domain-containing protein [Coriobacteriales bacterium]|jgi:hypothetical protein|nr:DUF5663 domain-containing protein [Coriobacteriales bacterium]